MSTGTRKDIHYITIPALEKTGLIKHAFTTRQGGLGARSNGIKLTDDWEALAEAFGVNPERLVTTNQVHGENIVRVDGRNFKETKTVQADAMITNALDLAIGVETADCVPVLLFDPLTPAVGAVHAGWRSTVKRIVQKTVKKMQDEFGSNPARMIAAIGPTIGPECYEVDEPVMRPIRETFSLWKEVASTRGSDKWSLDLVKLNKLELVQVGLSEKNVNSLGLCTSCRRDLFYSFRAEGRTGRMLSVIMIKP
ncbi:MAG TPA: peptidoglycan editing factor PgeF [Nitrospirota bacterium]|nr:peptidoglycan editing factor PgeF [Nitrospirota bacterium]